MPYHISIIITTATLPHCCTTTLHLVGITAASTIIMMLKSYKSSLNLNSYKLDTRGYEEKIRDLTAELAEQRHLAQTSKSKEGNLYEQLKSTKLEVTTLRNMLKNQYVVHENKCKNCANNSKTSIDRLIAELEQQRSRTGQFKKMFENQMENKKQLTEYYQKKLHNLMRDKDILVKKYEEKIGYLSMQSLSITQSSPSSTSIQNHFSRKEIPTSPEKQTERRNFPPPSPKTSPVKSNPKQSNPSSSEESTISNLVGPIMEKMTKMQISLDELRSIPQVQRFIQATNPPKNRYIKLLRDFPFECEDDDLIQDSHRVIMQHLQTVQMDNTGANIIDYLTEKMKYF